MKLKNKRFIKKLLIAIVVIMLVFSFVAPAVVYAVNDVIGGVLFMPIRALFMAIFDGINMLMAGLLVNSVDTAEAVMSVTEDREWWEWLIRKC